MRGELQAFQAAVSELDVALLERSSTPNDDILRDAVLFRYWRALDLSLVAMRMALVDWFRDSAETLTIGELLRQTRTRGLLPDTEQWLPFYATRLDPSLLFDPKRSIEQARSFAVRSKKLIHTLAGVERRDTLAKGELANQESKSTEFG